MSILNTICTRNPWFDLVLFVVVNLTFFPLTFYFMFTLRKQLDPELNRQKYFHPNQALLPLYSLRRAGLYALYIAFPIFARRNFPDQDLQSKVTKPMLFWCRFYGLVMAVYAIYLFLIEGPTIIICEWGPKWFPSLYHFN